MQHITGTDRDQLFFTSLAQDISSDNPVRFVEDFVEQIDLLRLGFQLQNIKAEGRPSFATKLFLKIYLYGYLNGIRSSRSFDKEFKKI